MCGIFLLSIDISTFLQKINAALLGGVSASGLAQPDPISDPPSPASVVIGKSEKVTPVAGRNLKREKDRASEGDCSLLRQLTRCSVATVFD